MGLKLLIANTTYRLNVRKALSDTTEEQLKITYEECLREINRRNKRKKKK